MFRLPSALLMFCSLCQWRLGVVKAGKKLANLVLGEGAEPLRRRFGSSCHSPLRGAPEVTQQGLQTSVKESCLPIVFFPFFSVWMVAFEIKVAHLLRALCPLLCDAQGTREHQPPELLPPCKPWLCTWSREDDCRWNSTSYWVWQLRRVAISFCSHYETRSIGRGYCPPLFAWLPKAPNASILMGVILKESGKQLALFIDPEEEGKHAPISNFLMSSSIGKNAMAQGISRFFTV